MLTLSQLEQYLAKAAWILKGPVDAADFKVYIFPLLFFKRSKPIHNIWPIFSAMLHGPTKINCPMNFSAALPYAKAHPTKRQDSLYQRCGRSKTRQNHQYARREAYRQDFQGIQRIQGHPWFCQSGEQRTDFGERCHAQHSRLEVKDDAPKQSFGELMTEWKKNRIELYEGINGLLED